MTCFEVEEDGMTGTCDPASTASTDSLLPWLLVVTAVLLLLLLNNRNKTFLYGGNHLHYNKQSLKQYILKTCPSLMNYQPTLFLFNRHLQTLYLSLYKPPFAKVKREILELSDGGCCALDWYSTKQQSSYLMVIFHGMTGGSTEPYIQSLLSQLKDGRAVVVHARSCGKSPLKTPQLFNGGYTGDVRQVIQYLLKTTTDSLVLCGFSLGANYMVKYLGEEGEQISPRITCAFSIGNPWDLRVSNLLLHDGWLNEFLYSRYFCQNLKRMYFRHKDLLNQHLSLSESEIKKTKTVGEFDQFFTRILFQYDSVYSYAREESSVRYLHRVRLPLICLNARNDPISPKEAIPYLEAVENPNILLIETTKGGHLGWFEQLFTTRQWSSRFIVEAYQAMTKAANWQVEEGRQFVFDRKPGMPLTVPEAVKEVVSEVRLMTEEQTDGGSHGFSTNWEQVLFSIGFLISISISIYFSKLNYK